MCFPAFFKALLWLYRQCNYGDLNLNYYSTGAFEITNLVEGRPLSLSSRGHLACRGVLFEPVEVLSVGLSKGGP